MKEDPSATRVWLDRRALWHAINPPIGGRCRDCADEDGRCPTLGLPCDPQEAALETLAKMRAEVARLTAERQRLVEALEFITLRAGKIGERYFDNRAEFDCWCAAYDQARAALAAGDAPPADPQS